MSDLPRDHTGERLWQDHAVVLTHALCVMHHAICGDSSRSREQRPHLLSVLPCRR